MAIIVNKLTNVQSMYIVQHMTTINIVLIFIGVIIAAVAAIFDDDDDDVVVCCRTLLCSVPVR